MTYESILSDLSSTFNYFIDVLTTFIDFIAEYPLLMVGSAVIIVLPAIFLIFTFISDEAQKALFDIPVIVMNKHDSLMQKKSKKKMENEARIVARRFFENNPNRMSIRINGFTFYQEGFENRNWSNSKRTRVTKKMRVAPDGSLQHYGTSITSTETYDNTTASIQEDTYDAD